MSSLLPNDFSSAAAKACDCALKLAPIFQERVWGCEDLSFLYSSRPRLPRRVGEVWLTCDQNRIINGAWADSALGHLMKHDPETLLGTAPSRSAREASFPLLVKFLFTTDKLSVQVHPADAYAREREGSAGKTEMWHVLLAEPGARLAIGFRKELARGDPWPRSELRRAVHDGSIETMLHWMEARQGDTFFVPAGAVHAIGAGLVLCEIQQNSDVTYRFYDYNRPGTDGRPRPLHVEQALDVLEWRTPGGRTTPAVLADAPATRLCLAACPYFATERVSLGGPFPHAVRGRFEIWIALEGSAGFRTAAGTVDCLPGEVVVLPAGLGSVSIVPAGRAVFLRTFPPNLEAEVAVPLRARGVSEEQLRRVCFAALPGISEDRE